jgi:hypothetical protein
MKKIIFFSLVITLIIGSCAQKVTKSPYEGAWEMVGYTSMSGDTATNYKIPSPENGSQIKLWTKNRFAFTGIVKTDTSEVDVYGSGTYTLVGDKYEESIIYHNDKKLINIKDKFLLELRNDTLFQKGPADDKWNLPRQYGIEKYLKAE